MLSKFSEVGTHSVNSKSSIIPNSSLEEIIPVASILVGQKLRNVNVFVERKNKSRCVRDCVNEFCQGIWLPKKDCTQRRPGWAGGQLSSLRLVSSLGLAVGLGTWLPASCGRGKKI